jgi:hypothetical protein
MAQNVKRRKDKPFDNRRLYGLVEWVLAQKGTVKQFNEYILVGRVRGVRYRYFVHEYWAGVLPNDETSMAIQCKTLEAFIQTVEKQSEQPRSAEEKRWVS